MKFEIQEYNVDTVEVESQVNSVSSQVEALCELADGIEVNNIVGLNNALEAIESLSTLSKTLESIVEPFRKKAYDHYKSILDEKNKLVGRPKEAINALRNKIKEFNKRVEQAKAEEAKALAEAGGATGEQIAQIEAPVATQSVEGLQWREQWGARLSDDSGDALRLLCGAIAKGEAPVALVVFNQSEANKLARSLKDLMRIPGIVSYREKVPVVRRR